jgi:hypothetical protein
MRRKAVAAEQGQVTRFVQHSLVRVEEEVDDVERVSYTHNCVCGHQVAKHKYKFKLEDGYQIYTMKCLLW